MRFWRLLAVLLCLWGLAGCGALPAAEQSGDEAPPAVEAAAPETDGGLSAAMLEREARTLTEEEVRAAYDRAETAYGWFYLETLPSGPQTQEVDGWTYERVDYPGMENLADLQAYLRGLFSEEMVDDLLAVGGSHPLYRDVDGVLYVLPSGRERDPSKGAAVIQVEHTGETVYSVDVTVDLLDENGETVTGVECYAFPYEFVEDLYGLPHGGLSGLTIWLGAAWPAARGAFFGPAGGGSRSPKLPGSASAWGNEQKATAFAPSVA